MRPRTELEQRLSQRRRDAGIVKRPKKRSARAWLDGLNRIKVRGAKWDKDFNDG